MAIQHATPPRDAGTRPIDDVQQLRQKINALINERDFWQTQAESKTAKLERLAEDHRYSLKVECDAFRCAHTIGVSSSKAPIDGTLAYALLCTAAAMGWVLGPETMKQLIALLPAGMLADASRLPPTGAADRCHAHR